MSTVISVMGGSQMSEAVGLGHMASQGLGWGRQRGPRTRGAKNHNATVVGAPTDLLCEG